MEEIVDAWPCTKDYRRTCETLHTLPKPPPSADGGDGPRGCYKGDGYIVKEWY